jgi:hypothetical protein
VNAIYFGGVDTVSKFCKVSEKAERECVETGNLATPIGNNMHAGPIMLRAIVALVSVGGVSILKGQSYWHQPKNIIRYFENNLSLS